MPDEKGLTRGGVGGMEAELTDEMPDNPVKQGPQQRGGSASIPQGGMPGTQNGGQNREPNLDREPETRHEVD